MTKYDLKRSVTYCDCKSNDRYTTKILKNKDDQSS